jgi:hypothetical protein
MPFYNNGLGYHCSFDTIVAFVIPFVALLTSSPVMWRNFGILVFSKEYTFKILFLVLIMKIAHVRATALLYVEYYNVIMATDPLTTSVKGMYA